MLAPTNANIGAFTVTVIGTDDAATSLNDSTSFSIDVIPIGPPQLAFTDVTGIAGIGGPAHFGGHGVQFADVDGVGLADVYVTMNFEPTDMPELFYRNRSERTFSQEAGLRGIDNFDTGSHGGVWADLDNDGDYDLFNGSCDQNRLYRNDGTGLFQDITNTAGIPIQSLRTPATISFDMDRDGDLDIFAVTNAQGTNDPAGELNEVSRNDGNLSFTSVSAGALESAPDGISYADVNNDGWLHLMLNQHLFVGTGGGQFALAASFETATYHYMGGFADLDNDGDWDLVFPGRNYVYINDGTGSFTQSPTFLIGAIDDPRSVAFADIDQDGDLDFFYAQKRQFNLLIRNDLVASNRWLKILLRRTSGQVGAFGAKVTLYEDGGLNDPNRRIVWKETTSATGYLAQDDPELHLGVGLHLKVDIKVEFPITVGFPDGVTKELQGVETNSLVEVQE